MATTLSCPNCGSLNVKKTTKGTVTQVSTQFGAGFCEGVVKEAANGLLFEGAGHLVPKFGSSLASRAKLEYVCNVCDGLFNVSFHTNGDVKDVQLKKLPMPEEIIKVVRESYITECKKKRPIVSLIIWSLLTIYGCVLMVSGIISDEFFSGIFTAMVGMCTTIVFAIPAIIKLVKLINLNNQIKTAENQTLREFKHYNRDLFYQYNQYH